MNPTQRNLWLVMGGLCFLMFLGMVQIYIEEHRTPRSVQVPLLHVGVDKSGSVVAEICSTCFHLRPVAPVCSCGK